MRKIFLSAFVILLAGIAPNMAQVGTSLADTRPYLLEHFTEGSVLMKNGSIEKAMLNYNSADQHIFFQKEGQTFILIDLPSVDTVYLGGKKFVVGENSFYEVITNLARINLYATYQGKLRPSAATTEHSGTTNTDLNQVSNTVSNIYVSRPYKGDYTLDVQKQYWLRGKVERGFHRTATKKQLIKSIPESIVADVNSFVENNHLNLSNEEDLIKLVGFCDSRLH